MNETFRTRGTPVGGHLVGDLDGDRSPECRVLLSARGSEHSGPEQVVRGGEEDDSGEVIGTDLPSLRLPNYRARRCFSGIVGWQLGG